MDRYIPVEENFIRIIYKKCNGCGNCVIVCGGEVFEIRKKKSVVVQIKHCLECGNCEVACLRNAIRFRVPRSGTGIVYKYG